MKRSSFLGVGSYLPEKVLSNDDLSCTIDTTDEWIFTRTGVKQRHIVSKDEFTSSMAFTAANRALVDAQILPEDIDLIIVATTTPDKTFPSCATMVQSKLNCKSAFAFDIQAVCSGFIYALSVADQFIRSGKIKTALVIGSESMSKIVNWHDRSTCILFGDGAGAIVLRSIEEDSGIISTHLHSDGNFQDILHTDGGVSYNNKCGFINMEGKEVFKHAVEKLTSVIMETLEHNGIDITAISWFIPHQANIRIINSVAEKIKCPKEKIISTVDKHANTSAASIPLALDHAKSTGKLKKGDIILLAAIGGGLTWGSCLLKI